MDKSKSMESLIRQAEAVDCGRYDLNYSELAFLTKECNNNFINGSFLLFKIGFLKGQRAEKAKKKRKRQSTIA